MFKIKKQNTVKRPVTVYIPTDGEGFTKGIYTAELKVIDQETMESLRDGGDKALVEHVLVAAHDVVDENGGAIDPEEARNSILSEPAAITATAATYLDMTVGRNLRSNRR